MLITSKFRDFYDNCAAYGVDTKVRYVRNTEEFRMKPWAAGQIIPAPKAEHQTVLDACDGWGRALTGEYSDNFGHRDPYVVGVFGFCGVLHRVVSYYKSVPTEQSIQLKNDYFDKKVYHIAFSKDDMPQEWDGKFRNWRTARTLFEDFAEPMSRENLDPFIALNTPMFLAFDNRLIVNPCMKDRGLTRFKDGVSVFQEISSFISGTLDTAKQMKHTASDQELIQAHGFDKQSFRKRKDK